MRGIRRFITAIRFEEEKTREKLLVSFSKVNKKRYDEQSSMFRF